MKHPIILLSILLASLSASAQTVASSCEAPDSVVAIYKTGADMLAIREIYARNLAYTDSVPIPQQWSDTILHALIAVYNATSLPARDSVVDIYPCIRPTGPFPNAVAISTDSNIQWMHHFRDGIIPTGYNPVDSIMALYQFTFNYYGSSQYNPHSTVYIHSVNNYNLGPIDTFLQTLPDVHYAEQPNDVVMFTSVVDTIYSDRVGLTYEYSWGDCFLDCINHHFWKFDVYPDCSVTYKGSYGDPINPTAIANINKPKAFTVFPNPVKDKIIHYSLPQGFKGAKYELMNMAGQVIQQGNAGSGQIDVAQLAAGSYILRIVGEKSVAVERVMIE